MELDMSLIVSVFNIIVVILLLLGFFIGFIRGFRKSMFYFIFFILFVIIGFVFFPYFSNKITNYDLGKFSAELNGQTLKIYIENFITNSNPEIALQLQEGELLVDLVDGLLYMGVRIIYVILLFVIGMSIWSLITSIFWAFFKKKQKKSLPNRTLGGLIGVGQSFIFVLFLLIPLVLFNDANRLYQHLKTESEPDSELITISDDGDSIVDFNFYDQTIIYKVLNKFKINNTSLDQLIADQLLYVEFNNSQYELRRDITLIADVLDILNKDDDLDFQNIDIAFNNLSEKEKEIVKKKLSQVKVYNIAIPVALEYLIVNESELLYNYNEELEIDLNNLLVLDYNQEITILPDAGFDLFELLYEENLQEINYFSLDPNKVENIFTNISNLQLVDIVGAVGFNYLTSLEGLQEYRQLINIDFKDISFKEEIANLGNVYRALYNLSLDSNNIENIDYKNVNDEDIIFFSKALIDSKIINEVIPILVDYAVFDLLPENFNQYITKENIKDVNWDEDELSSLLLITKNLLSNGVLEEDFDFKVLFTENNIDKLSSYIAQSKLVTNNLTSVLQDYLNNSEITYLNNITFNDNLVWSQNELFSVFSVFRISLDLINEANLNIENLEDEVIDEFSTYLTNSVLLKSNLTVIFNNLSSEFSSEFTLEIEEDFDWTYLEVNSLVKSLKIVSLKNGETNQILNLSDDEIDIFLSSTVITKTIISILYDLSDETHNLHNILIINISKDDDLWFDKYSDTERISDGELRKVFKSINILLGEDFDLENIVINLDRLTTLSDDDINVLIDSLIISQSVVNQIITLSSSGSLQNIIYIPQLYQNLEYHLWYGIDGELRNFILATQVLMNGSTSLEELDFNVNVLFAEETKSILLQSVIITETFIHTIENSSVTSNILITTHLRDEGELDLFIDALEVIIGEDGNLETLEFNLDILYNDTKLDIILASAVMSDSIINYIETSAIATDGTLITTRLHYEGELRRLITGLKEIVPGGSIDNVDLDVSVILDKDLDIILASMVLEDSIINKVEQLFTPEGILYDYFDLPSDISWHRTYYEDNNFDEGDLKPFIESIKMLDEAGVNYNNISLEAIVEADSNELATALLHSRVISNSISKMLNKTLEDAEIPYTVEHKEYTHAELVDELESIKTIYYIFNSL